MRKLLTFLITLAAIVFAVYSPVSAQYGCKSFGQQGGTGCNSAIASGGYTGPGDVSVNGSTNNWYAWYSCARVYSAAQASTSTSLCDLVDSAAPTVVICTLRGTSSGLVDLVGTYCTGGVTPATKCAAATGGVCNVSQAYDQSGNSRPVVNATAASQPFLVFSALNGLPSMQCTAASCFLGTSGTYSPAQPYTMSAVYIRPASGSGVGGIIGASNVNVMMAGNTGASSATVYGGTTGAVATAADNVWHALNGLISGTGNNCAINVDGSDTTSLNCGTTNFNTSNIRIMRSNALQITASLTEAGMLNVTSSPTDRGNICHNQKTYYATGGSC